MIDENTVNKLLDMSRIDIKPETKHKFLNQIKEIVSFVEKIGGMNTDQTDNRETIFEQSDVLRDDNIEPTFTHSELRKYTKNFIDGYYAVPKVITKNDNT